MGTEALQDLHLSSGRETRYIDTEELRMLYYEDKIVNKLTEDSPILHAQIGSAFMTMLYNNMCNDIDHAVGLENVSDDMVEEAFKSFLVANASLVVTKNAKSFLKKRKKMYNGISVYSDSCYVPTTGEKMSFRIYLHDKPTEVSITVNGKQQKIVVGGHEEYDPNYLGDISKYSSQTSISDIRIIGFIRTLLMAKIPLFEIDVIERPYYCNDGRGERTEKLYNIHPRKVNKADGQMRVAAWNLYATRVTTIGDNFIRDVAAKEKVDSCLEPFVMYSHDSNCEQKSKTKLNQSNDGGGFIVSSDAENNQIIGNISDDMWNIKIMGEMFVTRMTSDGREYKRIAKLVKANLDVISFQDAIDLGLFRAKDVSALKKVYNSGTSIIISNDNPIKDLIELKDEKVDLDPLLKCPSGYFGIIDVNSRLKLDPGASFNGVLRSLPVSILKRLVKNNQLSAGSSGVLSFSDRALNALNVTPYDIIGKPLIEHTIYVKSQAIKDRLTGGDDLYVLMYRFPLDGNFAVCKVIVDESIRNHVKPTCYAMFCIGGDFDGDGIGIVSTDIPVSVSREDAIKELKIFDTMKTTCLDDFLAA